MANATANEQETAHVCLDTKVAQIDVLKAAELAIEENPDNAPSGSVDVAHKPGVTPNYEIFGAVLTGKKWKPGRTLSWTLANFRAPETAISQTFRMFREFSYGSGRARHLSNIPVHPVFSGISRICPFENWPKSS